MRAACRRSVLMFWNRNWKFITFPKSIMLMNMSLEGSLKKCVLWNIEVFIIWNKRIKKTKSFKLFRTNNYFKVSNKENEISFLKVNCFLKPWIKTEHRCFGNSETWNVISVKAKNKGFLIDLLNYDVVLETKFEFYGF